MKNNVLHLQAEDAREQDKHLEALKLIEAAFFEYQQDQNYEGLCQALQSRCLTYKHLFYLADDQVFAIMAQKDAEASLAIAKLHDLKNLFGSSYFRLGEITMLFDDYSHAVEYYKQSLDHYFGTECEKGDYRYHFGEALYRLGKKKEGKKQLKQGLREIQDNSQEVGSFLFHVWESGAHMRLADLLRDDDLSEAKKHLAEAEDIISSDPKLVIRKRQLELLKREKF